MLPQRTQQLSYVAITAATQHVSLTRAAAKGTSTQ